METSINYPSNLPLPLHDGHSVNHVSPILSSELQTGRVRKRRAYTTTPSIISVSWTFNIDDAIDFEYWFKETLKDGIEWFNMDVRISLGILPKVCRFVDIYTGPSLIGRRYFKFEADLETFERAVLVNDFEVIPLFWSQRDIFDVAMNREWPR